ncbi:hypothetical protein ACOCJ4_09890 [Knoellia sp. CPCC 206435]|uniref:hypothetical protein n=1 Tax=Knoellia terrae TaxID=3404797 RepID=UPI003B43270A
MPTVGHPSAVSPAIPHLELELPDDWVAEPGGDALFLAHRSSGGDSAPRLTAYVHTSREVSTDHLLDVLAGEATAHDEGESDPAFEVDIADRTWTGLNVSWLEDGQPVYVVHLVTPMEAGAVTQHVRLTGRVAGPDSESDYELIQQVMETTLVTPMGGGA